MNGVLVFSGGLDSTVLLYDLLSEGDDLVALSVDYGQRHVKELDAAQTIARNAGVPWVRASMASVAKLLMAGGGSQLDFSTPVPEGHYADPKMKATVVPNRNMILLAVAGAVAEAQKKDYVAYACHAGDYEVYKDCRPAFVDGMAEVLRLGTERSVQLLTPFVKMTKEDVVRRGAQLGVPFELTWSCYRGMDLHCGRCGACVERQEAFQLAKVPDPTAYEAVTV